MRYLATIASVFMVFGYWAQVSVFDCSVIDPAVSQAEIDANDDYYKQCILFTDQENYVFDQDDYKEVTALTEIHIKENFQAGQFNSGGQMHLKLAPRENLDVFSMNQANLGAIPRFDKFELGLDLPLEIDARIDDYFQGLNPTSSLNPFNPEEIDIEAAFYWIYNGQEYGPLKTFGFYYEEFTPNYPQETWDELGQSYKFRIRFAPRNLGSWRCKVTLKIDGVLMYEANSFIFQVVPSSNLDFTRVGNNKAYFEIGNKGYFPVGQNQPSVGIELTMREPNVRPPADYLSYQQSIQDLHSTGANYYRMLATPWGVEVEFEELGNYKDRMPNAWEMDRILDYTRDLENSNGKPFRMHFNMMIHYHVQTVNDFAITNWDWAPGTTTYYTAPCVSSTDNGYCYATSPILNTPLPKDFITSSEARNYYKRRLRYMVARWGYSTSINLFEILSEANNTGIWADLQPVYDSTGTVIIGCKTQGNIQEPYKYDANFPGEMYVWHHEMAEEIKRNTAHGHPVAVNYTGAPQYTADQGGVHITNGDYSYLSPYVDVVTYNHYVLSHTKYEDEGNLIRDFRNASLSPNIKKPLMYSEIGYSSCDYNTNWKQQILLSGFTGAAGAGLPWQHSHQDGPALCAQRIALWQTYGFVAQFFGQRRLDYDDYRSGRDIRNKDKTAELLYLRSFGDNNGPKMAIGAVQNRTVNYYTMRDGGVDGSCNLTDLQAQSAGVPQSALSVQDQGGNKSLKMTNMGGLNRYEIRWWNPLTGQELDTRQKWSGPFGDLRIEYDDLSADFSKAILYCQVRHDPVNGIFAKDTIIQLPDDRFDYFPNLENTSTPTTNQPPPTNVSITDEARVILFPNPSSGLVTVQLLGEVSKTPFKLRILDALGAQLEYHENLEGSTVVDLSNYAKGVYFFVVEVANQTMFNRLTKL